MLSLGAMTARIHRLERAGLVEPRPHPTNRRGTLVTLTPKGLSLINRILADVENTRSALSMPSDAEPRQLNALSIKLIAGVSNADHRRVTLR